MRNPQTSNSGAVNQGIDPTEGVPGLLHGRFDEGARGGDVELHGHGSDGG